MKKSNIGDVLNPTIKEPQEILKEVKVQHTGRQLVLPIPSLFAEIVGIKKGDIFIFKASLKNKEYSIRWQKKK
ncbi:hypothetical protein J4225_01325 [Candidatus Pacearchaeota archaeon]|nr:hypothetical protein [Candidatus Pacearchaeota archaeon]